MLHICNSTVGELGVVYPSQFAAGRAIGSSGPFVATWGMALGLDGGPVAARQPSEPIAVRV